MSSAIAMRELTPIFDTLITELGDPVVSPPVDRSLATLTAQADTARSKGPKTSLKSVATPKLPAKRPTDSKSDQDKDSNAASGTTRPAS